MGEYGQFCPVAKAMELLDERWTVLVVREILCGSRHFNEIRRGVPKMSPALLTKRLQRLERCGVLERRTGGNRIEYVLTQAGEELRPVVEQLGTWSVRWLPDLGDADLDPHLLMWDIRRGANLADAPASPATVHFGFTDVEPSAGRWWLTVGRDGADSCDFDPGHPIVATVRGELRWLSRVWRGDVGWPDALRAGGLVLTGEPWARRAVPRWFAGSSFAAVPRHVPG
jgi:DNA-binding HxlR family transcriptional regulator